MIEVKLPVEAQHRLPYYLALEEWVACFMPDDDYIFSWRVQPTVICGRNQDMPLEVNLNYCRENGIDVVRRRSGGGCVYADMNNYMFSFVTPGIDVEANFARYSRSIAEMLKSLGIDAKVSGRNDILVGDAKIAGNAFYICNGKSVAHGTMLFDIDEERLQHAITPSRAKLESKAVQSVPNHLTCLRAQGIELDLKEFERRAIDYFTAGRSITLSHEQAKEIEKIEARYYDVEFLYGRIRDNASGNLIRRFRRVDNVGDFYAEIELDKDRSISRLLLSGTFLP